MDRDDEQLLRGRVYGTDHDHPGRLPRRNHAQLVGGPLDGLLLDITGWTAHEIQTGVALTTELGPDERWQAVERTGWDTVPMEARPTLCGDRLPWLSPLLC